jgi:hypothetical protein
MNERSSTFLMANLGSEVSRICRAKDEKDMERLLGAFTRASKIIEEIKKKPDMEKRMEEISLLEKAVESIALGKHDLSISSSHLQSYFTPFAMRSMPR